MNPGYFPSIQKSSTSLYSDYPNSSSATFFVSPSTIDSEKIETSVSIF